MVDENANNVQPVVQAPKDTAGAGYVNVYDDTLPAAKGMIAKTFGDKDPGELKTLCKAFYTFLQQGQPNLLQLSNDLSLYTALVPLPASYKCRLVYGFGLGTSPLGGTSPIDNQILALYQEGDKEIGPPLHIMLPPTMIATEERLCPSGQKVQASLMTAQQTTVYPMYRSASVGNDKESMMMMAPVPAHLFLDGFDKDLDAPVIYERLLRCAEVEEEYVQHALKVVRSALVQPNRDQHCVHLSMEAVIQSGSCKELRKWAHSRAMTMFPSLKPPMIANIPMLPPTPPAHMVPRPPPLAEEVQIIKAPPPTKERITKREQQKLFTMLGFDKKVIPHLKEADLPTHMRAVEDEVTKHMKDSVIKERLSQHVQYEECPVPAHPAILETLRKRDFGGMDNFMHPSYAHACSKLSPFLCMDMTETQMAKLHEMEEALSYATATTPADYIAMKSTRALVPKEYMDFVHLLCTFANLIFAWFTAASPLYIKLKMLINAIKAFHRTARSFFTLETKATILWLTFLQTRMFAEGTDEEFTPFTRMIDNLTAKDAVINYAEVPAELISNSKKAHGLAQHETPARGTKRSVDEAGMTTPENPSKPPRQNPNNWHPKIKQAIGPTFDALRKKGFNNFKLSLKQVCAFCGVTNKQFSTSSSVCTSNKVLGHCFSGDKCKFKHIMASDTEADKIIVMLDKIKSDQEGFKDQIANK